MLGIMGKKYRTILVVGELEGKEKNLSSGGGMHGVPEGKSST